MALSTEQRAIAARLTSVRTEIVKELPFFGRLLLHLRFGLAECETAYTDQKKIVFDPSFVNKLGDTELKFIMLHELFHCVLNHCTRTKGKIDLIYNIACDIVVNSIILEMLGMNDIEIDGDNAMHLTPNDKEGRNYTADEVYDMLINAAEDQLEKKYGNTIDNHRVWASIKASSMQSEIWKMRIKEASQACSIDGAPLSIRRYMKKLEHNSKCNWRQLLHDYIQYDKSDYTFSHPDRRYLYNDTILPSFMENVDGYNVRKLWAVIDTSGSVSDDGLANAMNEIYGSISQVNMNGWVSFFDTDVSEPIPFKKPEDLKDLEPIGCGGTDFEAIFRSIPKYFENELPEIIVVLTDGYADFPDESEALGIPVIWVIIDSDVEVPWGKAVYID